jgi:hypothetical protein
MLTTTPATCPLISKADSPQAKTEGDHEIRKSPPVSSGEDLRIPTTIPVFIIKKTA